MQSGVNTLVSSAVKANDLHGTSLNRKKSIYSYIYILEKYFRILNFFMHAVDNKRF